MPRHLWLCLIWRRGWSSLFVLHARCRGSAKSRQITPPRNYLYCPYILHGLGKIKSFPSHKNLNYKRLEKLHKYCLAVRGILGNPLPMAKWVSYAKLMSLAESSCRQLLWSRSEKFWTRRPHNFSYLLEERMKGCNCPQTDKLNLFARHWRAYVEKCFQKLTASVYKLAHAREACWDPTWLLRLCPTVLACTWVNSVLIFEAVLSRSLYISEIHEIVKY